MAWALVGPVLAVLTLVALFPLVYTAWESLHLHDLRMPWRGRPFVGALNYREALADARLLAALARTLVFATVSVFAELVLGTVLALALNHGFRLRGMARTVSLLPWALPTVVVAVVWRFLFDEHAGPAARVLEGLGLAAASPSWFSSPWLAWVPVILADVWKTTPFVAFLVLAGLQTIDPTLYEAARIDGARRWQRLRHITLPALKPALAVALVFRFLDALRVFDLIYVMTGGGPGTATEPLALYTFTVLLQNLRFGYGSALSLIIFSLTFSLALATVRFTGAGLLGDRRR